MLGVVDELKKEVLRIEPLANLRKERARAEAVLPLGSPDRESERNRFLIDPAEIVRIEKAALAQGLGIVGFYHSHPDHPARPSGYDLEHAFPWYSYVIIRVEAGAPGECTSWVLREDRTQFDEERLEIGSRAAAGELAGAGAES